jgi:hypothetical protein
MRPYLNQALANLIAALNYPQSRENHYVMKGVSVGHTPLPAS